MKFNSDYLPRQTHNLVLIFRLADGKKPFEIRIIIPKMRITSKYSSSGVLIILPASGNGTFHAALGDVSTVCRGIVSNQKRNGEDYLHIDSMELDLEVKNVRMLVKKVFNNNRILSKYCVCLEEAFRRDST